MYHGVPGQIKTQKPFSDEGRTKILSSEFLSSLKRIDKFGVRHEGNRQILKVTFFTVTNPRPKFRIKTVNPLNVLIRLRVIEGGVPFYYYYCRGTSISIHFMSISRCETDCVSFVN